MSFILAFFWCFLQTPLPADAQTLQPTPTPDSRVPTLESMISTQQVEIDSLKHDLEISQKEQNLENKEIRWTLDQKLIYASILFSAGMVILGFLGFNSYRSIDEKVKNKIDLTLKKQLYLLDPSNLLIRLPQDSNMQREWVRLNVAGFKNTKWYQGLDKKCYEGITIVRISGDQDAQDFVDFIQRNQTELDPTKAGFVLYTPLRLSEEVLNSYANLGVINISTQIVGAVMAVGRGIIPQPAEN